MKLFKQIAIYGVGLMGASLGLATRDRKLAEKVVGVGRNAERLQKAVDLGCIEEFTTDPPQLLSSSDLIVLSTPVTHIVKILPEVAAAVANGAIVTDLGSTKTTLVEEAEKHFHGERYFVGSHPICGSEKSGADFARANLYENACCIVTPTENSNPEAVQRVAEFWTAHGCRITSMPPRQHDHLLALVSHAPHMVAVALIESLRQSGEDADLIRTISGSGLRDTTRVAEGPAPVWLDICRENREAIIEAIRQSENSLHTLRKVLEEKDDESLEQLLKQAGDYRSNL